MQMLMMIVEREHREKIEAALSDHRVVGMRTIVWKVDRMI
jgi:hypothetical protein